jgi:hypothetical protein
MEGDPKSAGQEKGGHGMVRVGFEARTGQCLSGAERFRRSSGPSNGRPRSVVRLLLCSGGLVVGACSFVLKGWKLTSFGKVLGSMLASAWDCSTLPILLYGF